MLGTPEEGHASPIWEARVLDEHLAKFNRRMLVYLSGKYRDVDEHSIDRNIHHAKKAAVELWKIGFSVLCPHGNTAHMGFDGDDDVFLEGDMVMVERSDLVVMLDNWQESVGARLERRLALNLGIPVYYWPFHKLALQRIAAHDHRYRDAGRAIIDRAKRISLVTGWRPGVHVSPDSDSGACDSCGSARSDGGMSTLDAGTIEKKWREYIESHTPARQMSTPLSVNAVRPSRFTFRQDVFWGESSPAGEQVFATAKGTR